MSNADQSLSEFSVGLQISRGVYDELCQVVGKAILLPDKAHIGKL